MGLGLTCQKRGVQMSKNVEFKKQIERTEKYVMWFAIVGMSSALSLIVSILLN